MSVGLLEEPALDLPGNHDPRVDHGEARTGSSRSRHDGRRGRGNRVVEQHAVPIALIAGVVAALSDAAPTGQRPVDIVLAFVAASVVTYGAASATWWVLAASAAVGAAVAGGAPQLALAAAALACAFVIGWRRRNQSWLRATSAGLTVNVLFIANLDLPFATTAAIGIATGAAVFVAGIRRRARPVRRIAWLSLGGVAALAVLAVVAFVAEAAASRSALNDGRRQAQLGVSAVEHGDYNAAALHFARASDLLDDSRAHLERPWVWPAAGLPIVAQHRTAALELSTVGEEAVGAAAAAVADIDPERLRVDEGQIDLAALQDLGGPIASLNGAMDELGSSIRAADSPWLLPVVGDELSALSAELDENTARLNDVATAVALAPQMLGADGPRMYLVLFTTPAEARGLGGFIGNYAELTVDQGHIDMTQFGRVSNLEILAEALGVRISGPPDFLRRYGTFGFNEDGQGLVGSASWRNLSISPDFPSVATVAAEMYEQITGKPVDGVIAIDPYTMQSLIGYTGPLALESVDYTVDSTNAARFIVLDQYFTADHADRVDALEEVARRTVDALLAGSIPGPNRVARDLGPFADAGRLAMWASDPDEAALLERVGLLNALPELDGGDGWSVTVTNAAGSKIDTFLRRDFSYDAHTADGVTTARLTATFTNGAPATGMPDYVIGNVIGLPTGTSRLYVSFYSALDLRSATIGGEPLTLTRSSEGGWNVYSGFVTIASGGSVTFDLSLSGTVAEPDRVVTWTQPLVIPPALE